MAKIITVTANTAIDFFIEIDRLDERDNILAKSCTEFAGGKGINVAKAIESLNHSVLCLGFAGRESMHLYNGLNSGRLQTDLIAIDGRTRINITLFDAYHRKETHIRTSGFSTTADDYQALAEKLETSMRPGDVVVFSGSLPSGAPADMYRHLIERCHSQRAIPILDTSGQSLSSSLKAGPYLIKPNQPELGELIGETLADQQAVAAAARTLLDQGPQWVYVSRGRHGVVAVGETGAFSACIKNEDVSIVSSIGCGDAMVAGLAIATLQGLNPEETIKLGTACGTANLFSAEPGRLDNVKVSKLLNLITLSKL